MPRYQPNSLFRGGQNWHLNACIGTNGGPYDYGDFSRGYFAAAFHMVEALAEGDRPGLFLDICVYPIVANFRHALELSMKHSIVIANRYESQPEHFPTSHDLRPLLSTLKSRCDSIDPNLIETEDWDFMLAAIEDFSRTDPKGMVFRYPEDLQRQLQIDAFELLNIQVLYEAMKRCQDILDRIDAQITHMADFADLSTRSLSK
jgi:hypothetical protein